MKYLRRLLWFLTSKIFWACIIFGLLIVCFYYAMAISNIYILLDEGLELRAQTAVTYENNDLTKYFRDDFLSRDAALHQDTYKNYNISSYSHDMTLESAWSWPWENTATATVVERMSVNGTLITELGEQTGEQQAQEPPPEWATGRYNITLIRERATWKIADIRLVELLPDE